MFGEKQRLQAAQINARAYQRIDMLAALETIQRMLGDNVNRMIIIRKIIDVKVDDQVHEDRINSSTLEQLEGYYGKTRGQ